MNPVHAARDIDDPVLMRRTPISARSGTRSPVFALISTFTGFGLTALTIASICPTSVGPGAYKTSAPASEYACNLLIASLQRVSMAHQKTLGPRREQHICSGRIDRFTRGPDSFHGQREIVQRLVAVARGIFDRQSRHARFDTQPDTLSNALGLVSIPGLKICIYRQIHSSHNLRDMLQGGIARHAVFPIREPARESES